MTVSVASQNFPRHPVFPAALRATVPSHLSSVRGHRKSQPIRSLEGSAGFAGTQLRLWEAQFPLHRTGPRAGCGQ